MATTDPDTAILLLPLEGASDPDGDELHVIHPNAPGHVVIASGPSALVLHPRKDFRGTIVVTYGVDDAHGNTVEGRTTVTVARVNAPPVANEANVLVSGRTTMILTGSDRERAALRFEIVTGPAHGTLDTKDLPYVTYVPEPQFTGEDQLTFRVHDGTQWSQPAIVRLNVSIAPPVALADTVAIPEDTSTPVMLRATDASGAPLTYDVGTVSHGTLTGTPPLLQYTPAPDFFGIDELKFSVIAAGRRSSVATFRILVEPVNDAPVAASQAVSSPEDAPRTIIPVATDVDGDFTTFRVEAGPSHGVVTIFGAQFVYTPKANYDGPDSFTFAAVDSRGAASAPATVTIDVTAVEDPPTALPLAIAVSEDTAALVQLQGDDADGDPVTYAITAQPTHGTLSGRPPDVTYTPAANYSGPDQFSYTASSREVTSPPAQVALTVTPVNDPPVALDDELTTAEDTPLAITFRGSDVEGAALSFRVITPPRDGTLTLIFSPTTTYIPARDATGNRTLTFEVSDGQSTSRGTVTIHVTPVNDAPTARDDVAVTAADTAVTIDVIATDTDVDGDALTIDSVAAPAHGEVEIVDNRVVYTPEAGFTASDSFDYTVKDPAGALSTAKVRVGIGAFPPGIPEETIAQGDGFSSTERTPAISEDGRFVVLTTALPLVASDTNARDDIYVRDRVTRTFTRISVASDGTQSNGPSTQPHISANGQIIVFASTANNLVAGDTNGVSDVFRHDRATGTTTRVSVATGGGQGGAASFDPEVSADGNLVVFTSRAFDLVADDANGATDVFVRDVSAATTTRISVGPTGGDADNDSVEAAISGDGRFVVFASRATNLVAGDTNGRIDVFVRDLAGGSTARVSVSSTGIQSDQDCRSPSVSRDGRFVSFLSLATTLVPGIRGFSPLAYVRDNTSATTTVTQSSAASAARLSGDGRYAAMFVDAGAFIRDRFAAIDATSPRPSLTWSALSGNGRYMVSLTTAGAVVVLPNPR